MALATNYDSLCPLFDFKNSGGVLFPYFPLSLGQAAGNAKYINFDESDLSIPFARIQFPSKTRLITCEAFAVSNDASLKGASASTEPVLAVVLAAIGVASVGLGTEVGVITCTGAGTIGVKWAGTTTPTDVATTQEVIVHLKTAASSVTSANTEGAAVPVLWFAAVNSPA